jgi:hypothetical protein
VDAGGTRPPSKRRPCSVRWTGGDLRETRASRVARACLELYLPVSMGSCFESESDNADTSSRWTLSDPNVACWRGKKGVDVLIDAVTGTSTRNVTIIATGSTNSTDQSSTTEEPSASDPSSCSLSQRETAIGCSASCRAATNFTSLPGQSPMGGVCPRKDTAEQVTLQSDELLQGRRDTRHEILGLVQILHRGE